MKHIETVDQNYPVCVFWRGITYSQIPDGVGGVEVFHAVASAGVANEVGADAKSGRKDEVSGDAVVEVSGIDCVEVFLLGCGVAGGEIAAQSDGLSADLPCDFDVFGERVVLDGNFTGCFQIYADHIVVGGKDGVGGGCECELFLGAELPGKVVGKGPCVVAIDVVHFVPTYACGRIIGVTAHE